jgi:protein TonB
MGEGFLLLFCQKKQSFCLLIRAMLRRILPPLALSLAAHLGAVGLLVWVGLRALPQDQAGPLAVSLVIAPAAPAGAVAAMLGPPEVPPPPVFADEPSPEKLPLPPPLPTQPPLPPPVPASAPSEVPVPVARGLPASPERAPAVVVANAAASEAAVADWRQAVAAWIGAHQTYPQAARRRSEQGVAVLRFLLLPDGRVSGLTVAEGSGFAALDRAAMAVFEGARLPAPPAGTAAAERRMTVPMRYRLEER